MAVCPYGLHGMRLVGSPLWGGAEILDTVVSMQYFLARENETFTSGAKLGFRQKYLRINTIYSFLFSHSHVLCKAVETQKITCCPILRWCLSVGDLHACMSCNSHFIFLPMLS